MKYFVRLLIPLFFCFSLFAQTLELPEGVEIMKDQTSDPKPLVISKVDLEQRLESLKKAHQEAIANVNALGGAIQQVEMFLQELNARELEAKKPKIKEVPGVVEKSKKCDAKGCE
jgi:peptidoglycan hydrolase CwlO-like protein